MVTSADIDVILQMVPDPELPVSIVELGMVCAVTVESDHVHVELVPTYSGCPALQMIEADVTTRINSLDDVTSCTVSWRYEPAWTPDRISEDGKAKLQAHGITTPSCAQPATVTLNTSAIACPVCGSHQTRLDSPFGPTRCRAIYFCEACRNQFEHMKSRSPHPS